MPRRSPSERIVPTVDPGLLRHFPELRRRYLAAGLGEGVPVPEERLRAHQIPRCVVALRYTEAVAYTIRALKFHDRTSLAQPMAAFMTEALEAISPRPSFDLIVPLPLHPKRLRARGYNQAALLARAMAKPLGAEVADELLERVRPTARQSSLPDVSARIANVMGAFRAEMPAQVAGRTILLVDDVLTTGASLYAATTALREAGAADVVSAVLASSRG